MRELGYYLGVHPLGALTTVVATVLLYFSFAWLLRSWGQRVFASPSSFDLAVVSVLGAIVGRATMGRNPTLVGAIIALGTLFACEHVAGRVRGAINTETHQHRAVAVMVAGEVDEKLLARYRVDEAGLWSALRCAGISSPAEAALVVLEPHGQFSVLRSGGPVHDSALIGVRHAEKVRARLAAAGLSVPPHGGTEPA